MPSLRWGRAGNSILFLEDLVLPSAPRIKAPGPRVDAGAAPDGEEAVGGEATAGPSSPRSSVPRLPRLRPLVARSQRQPAEHAEPELRAPQEPSTPGARASGSGDDPESQRSPRRPQRPARAPAPPAADQASLDFALARHCRQGGVLTLWREEVEAEALRAEREQHEKARLRAEYFRKFSAAERLRARRRGNASKMSAAALLRPEGSVSGPAVAAGLGATSPVLPVGAERGASKLSQASDTGHAGRRVSVYSHASGPSEASAPPELPADKKKVKQLAKLRLRLRENVAASAGSEKEDLTFSMAGVAADEAYLRLATQPPALQQGRSPASKPGSKQGSRQTPSALSHRSKGGAPHADAGTPYSRNGSRRNGSWRSTENFPQSPRRASLAAMEEQQNKDKAAKGVSKRKDIMKRISMLRRGKAEDPASALDNLPESEQEALRRAFARYAKPGRSRSKEQARLKRMGSDGARLWQALGELDLAGATMSERRSTSHFCHDVVLEMEGRIDLHYFGLDLIPKVRNRLQAMRREIHEDIFRAHDAGGKGGLDQEECMQVLDRLCGINMDAVGRQQLEKMMAKLYEDCLAPARRVGRPRGTRSLSRQRLRGGFDSRGSERHASLEGLGTH